MKKILIVNAILVGENSGTGNTLHNIFCCYPQNFIMQYCTLCEGEGLKTTIKNTVFSGYGSVPIESFIKRIIKKKPIDNNAVNNMDPLLNTGLKTTVNEWVRGLLNCFRIHYDPKILKIIDNFSPDVIYTCGGSIRVIKSANYFSKRYKIKVILHLMDDWPQTLYTASWFSNIFRYIMLRQLKILHSNSNCNFAISEALCEKYQTLFKREYIPLMNPAKNIVPNVIARNEPKIRFTYSGSLMLNRWKTLLEIAEVLSMFRSQGLDNEFILYVPNNSINELQKEFESYGAELRSYVPVDQVKDIYYNSDILVYTESFDDYICTFTKYSLSTKVPEYMSSGKPILAYLPQNHYSTEYLLTRKAAFLAQNHDELIQCIKDIFTNEDLRFCVAEKGLHYARQEHSMEKNKIKLLKALEVS